MTGHWPPPAPRCPECRAKSTLGDPHETDCQYGQDLADRRADLRDRLARIDARIAESRAAEAASA